MKNKYTRKQIAEAIEYWKGKLQERNLDQMPLNESDCGAKLEKVIKSVGKRDAKTVKLAVKVNANYHPVTDFTIRHEKSRLWFDKDYLYLVFDSGKSIKNNTNDAKALLDLYNKLSSYEHKNGKLSNWISEIRLDSDRATSVTEDGDEAESGSTSAPDSERSGDDSDNENPRPSPYDGSELIDIYRTANKDFIVFAFKMAKGKSNASTNDEDVGSYDLFHNNGMV